MKYIRFSIRKKQFIIGSNCWFHNVISFYLTFFRLLLFLLNFFLFMFFFNNLPILLNRIILPILFFVFIFTLFIFPILFIFSFHFSFLLINIHFNCFKLYSRNNVFLFFQLLLKKNWKVIQFLVLLISFVCIHKCMTFTYHVHPHCLSWLEILGFLVLTSYTHISHLNFLLKIFNKPFHIFAELSLRNEETMLDFHVSLILQERCRNMQTEKTTIEILLKNSRFFNNFLLNLNNSIRIMPLGLHMLIKCISRIKDFPALIAHKLILNHIFTLLHLALKLLKRNRRQFDHFSLDIIPVMIWFIVFFV